MTGLTIGPRQFNFQACREQFTSGGTPTDAGWDFGNTIAGSNHFALYEAKVDLDAFNSNPGKAFSLLNVNVQESQAWSASTTQIDQTVPGCLVIDLISSVKIPELRWSDIVDSTNGINTNMPGFLHNASTNDPTIPENRQYNTSQILWGMWRLYGENRNVTYGAPPAATQMIVQSGQFGSGEVLVAPHAYYYKVVVVPHNTITVQIPSTICSVHGDVVDIPEFAELGQMARLGQR